MDHEHRLDIRLYIWAGVAVWVVAFLGFGGSFVG